MLDWATPDPDGTSVDLDDPRVVEALTALEAAGGAAGRAPGDSNMSTRYVDHGCYGDFVSTGSISAPPSQSPLSPPDSGDGSGCPAGIAGRYSRHSVGSGLGGTGTYIVASPDRIEHDDHRKIRPASGRPVHLGRITSRTGTELPALGHSVRYCQRRYVWGRSHRGRQRFLSWGAQRSPSAPDNFRQQRTVQCDIHHNAGEHRGSYQFLL